MGKSVAAAAEIKERERKRSFIGAMLSLEDYST
jgi:hypothetical protein